MFPQWTYHSLLLSLILIKNSVDKINRKTLITPNFLIVFSLLNIQKAGPKGEKIYFIINFIYKPHLPII